jgi:hypothetical protein
MLVYGYYERAPRLGGVILVQPQTYEITFAGQAGAAGPGSPDRLGVIHPRKVMSRSRPWPQAGSLASDLEDGGVMNRTPLAQVAEERDTMVNAVFIRALLRTAR